MKLWAVNQLGRVFERVAATLRNADKDDDANDDDVWEAEKLERSEPSKTILSVLWASPEGGTFFKSPAKRACRLEGNSDDEALWEILVESCDGMVKVVAFKSLKKA